MEKDESLSSLFMNISRIRDQSMSIRLSVDDDDLVQTTIDGISPSWEAFLIVVNGHEVQPNFERLWYDFLQE